MKILFIDEPLNPPGGGQLSILTILKNIDRSLYRVKVFLKSGGIFTEMLKKNNVDFEIVGINNLLIKILQFNPNLVHINSAAGSYSFFSAFFSKILGKKVIWHNRVAESSLLREMLISMFVDKIIVISDYVKRKFRYLDDKKVVKLYNPIDFNDLKITISSNELKNRLKIPTNSYVIGVFSRLEKWKGHEILFKSLTMINRDDIYLIVCGDGSLKSDLKLLAEKLNINGKIIFCGFIENVYDYMNICDVVVNPSVEAEAFGRVIIEAMSLGKIVVATNIGGPSELIENGVNGFLIPPDANSLSSILSMIINKYWNLNLIRKNAINKSKDFDIVNYIRNIYVLYNKILK